MGYNEAELEANEWCPMTEEEADWVWSLDSMDKTVETHEAKFLDSAIEKLEADSKDTFSCKQRNWIHLMKEKYL